MRLGRVLAVRGWLLKAPGARVKEETDNKSKRNFEHFCQFDEEKMVYRGTLSD